MGWCLSVVGLGRGLLLPHHLELLLEFVPQPQVVPAVGVDHILEVVGRVEELAVLPPAGAFLDIVIAGNHPVTGGRPDIGQSLRK